MMGRAQIEDEQPRHRLALQAPPEGSSAPEDTP